MKKIADPTNRRLEAALLDQKVAGEFHDKDYAYVPVMNHNGKPWAIGIAVEGEHGYSPIVAEAFTYDNRDDAADFCDGMNMHIGLEKIRAIEIVVSSMRRPNRLRLVAEQF